MVEGGVLVVVDTVNDSILYQSATSGTGNALTVEPSGELVITGGSPEWTSGTSGVDAYLVMQDDGNLVLYEGTGGSGIGGFLWGTAQGDGFRQR